MKNRIRWKSISNIDILNKYKFLVQEHAIRDYLSKTKYHFNVSFFHTKNFKVDNGKISGDNIPFMSTYTHKKNEPYFSAWVFQGPNCDTKWYLYDNIKNLMKDYFLLLLKGSLHK